MKELIDEINAIKEDIYTASIEKRKLNERIFSLNQLDKKVMQGYNDYKKLSDKVDNIKTLKDIKAFRGISLKNKSLTKDFIKTKKRLGADENKEPIPQDLVSKKELEGAFLKLHYSDKTTLEDDKVYLTSNCSELKGKTFAGMTVILFAKLSDDTKYEIEAGNCETMLRAYTTVDELKQREKNIDGLAVITLKKNSEYIPVMVKEENYAALIGGAVSIKYKEKINTGSNLISIWHLEVGN